MSLERFNEAHRFGSARFATTAEITASGLFNKRPNSLFLGFHQGRALYYTGLAGLVTCAGARSGKLRDVIAYSTLYMRHSGTLIVLDPKGEIAAISALQNKPCYHWNPLGQHGLPAQKINPVSYLRADSSSLISDIKTLCQNLIASSGAAAAAYFEDRARTYLEALIYTLVKRDGALTLNRLYQVINTIPGGGDDWLAFAFEMSESDQGFVSAVEEEIAQGRKRDTGGLKGILGELMRAVSALSDPSLRASVSPPFDVTLEQIVREGPLNLYLMVEAELLKIWAPIIRAFFAGLRIVKARYPAAPRQSWIIDEAAMLGHFPALVEAFSYGAGIGCRPWAIYQSLEQMKLTSPGAETIIPASAGVQQFFAVRDPVSAERLSSQLGTQSLEYDDRPAQARARQAKSEALHALVKDGDALKAAITLKHASEMAAHRSQQQRALRTPSEVLSTPGDRQYLWVDGLEHPIYAERAPYYAQRALAGAFLPSPFYPPTNRIRVHTWRGIVWRRVITEPADPRFASLPQYAHGLWSYIEGYKP